VEKLELLPDFQIVYDVKGTDVELRRPYGVRLVDPYSDHEDVLVEA
jgi:hypothetical protein